MDNIAEFNGYNGEIGPNVDKIESNGVAWYASYFNNEKINHISTQQIKSRFTLGMEIAANKLLNADEYKPRFLNNNVRCQYHIGNGSFSNVWIAKLNDGESVAVKQFDVRRVHPNMIWKERDLLIFLQNKRILKILGAFFEKDAFIVLELCFGNLTSVINQVNMKNALRFSVQLAEALNWIHSKNVIHCDLRPDNCLITTSNNLVLSDFGNAIPLPAGHSIVKSSALLGLSGYQDYESNADQTYCKESDMFSFGCVFFEMVSKRYLMQYGKADVPLVEYLKIYTEGRLINLQDWPPKNNNRETLTERIRQFANIFQPILMALVNDRQKRWSAKILLQSQLLRSLLRDNDIREENLDNDITQMVTTEQKRNVQKEFSFACSQSLEEAACAFYGLYYDEKEELLMKSNHFNLLNTNYDVNAVLKVLKTSNYIPQFIKALARNDPYSNAIVVNHIDALLQDQPKCVTSNTSEQKRDQTENHNSNIIDEQNSSVLRRNVIEKTVAEITESGLKKFQDKSGPEGRSQLDAANLLDHQLAVIKDFNSASFKIYPDKNSTTNLTKEYATCNTINTTISESNTESEDNNRASQLFGESDSQNQASHKSSNNINTISSGGKTTEQDRVLPGFPSETLKADYQPGPLNDSIVRYSGMVEEHTNHKKSSITYNVSGSINSVLAGIMNVANNKRNKLEVQGDSSKTQPLINIAGNVATNLQHELLRKSSLKTAPLAVSGEVRKEEHKDVEQNFTLTNTKLFEQDGKQRDSSATISFTPSLPPKSLSSERRTDVLPGEHFVQPVSEYKIKSDSSSSDIDGYKCPHCDYEHEEDQNVETHIANCTHNPINKRRKRRHQR